MPPGGPIQVRDLSPERFLVVADALAKSVALAHNERQVSAVFDVIDPLARDLARFGRLPAHRKNIIKVIGEALLVDHRMSGRVAVEDKPDVLWDRSDLERLYARLEDEYELTERARTLGPQARRHPGNRPRPDRPHRRPAQRAAGSHHRAADRGRDHRHVLPAVHGHEALKPARRHREERSDAATQEPGVKNVTRSPSHWIASLRSQ